MDGVVVDLPQEYAHHMVNSVVADRQTPDALAAAMLVLGTNASLRARLGAAGRAFVEREYSPEVVTRHNAAIVR